MRPYSITFTPTAGRINSVTVEILNNITGEQIGSSICYADWKHALADMGVWMTIADAKIYVDEPGL